MKNKLRHIIKEEVDNILLEEEEIFVPHDLEGRKEQRLQQIRRMLQQKHIEGDLNLEGLDITHLGNLETISGHLYLYNMKITSLRSLIEVGKNLYLENTPITSLGNLTKVGDSLYLTNTPHLFWDDIPKHLHNQVKGKFIGEQK